MRSQLVPMLVRAAEPKPRGEALASLMLGCPSLSLLLLTAGALLFGPVPGMSKRGLIATSYHEVLVGGYFDMEDGKIVTKPEYKSVPATTRDAPWCVPVEGFFAFTLFGLITAVLGVALRGKRRAFLSSAAFSAHVLVLVLGFVLLSIDAG